MKAYRAEVLHREDYRVTAWSGGKTTELSIEPRESIYADRDFLWRLSSATVELEESDFTSLPDYNRIIMTLEGSIELRHNGGGWIELPEYTPYSFDGADDTQSVGKVVDFNLMMRKGKCTGAVIPLRMMDNETADLGSILMQEMSRPDEIIIYCPKGHLDVTDERGEVSRLAPGETLRLEGDLAGKTWTLKALDGVAAVAAAVKYL
ncbi:MAG: HutD family protein [Clostridium sp.]|nr:HutD family protein [Clostridium sp.]